MSELPMSTTLSKLRLQNLLLQEGKEEQTFRGHEEELQLLHDAYQRILPIVASNQKPKKKRSRPKPNKQMVRDTGQLSGGEETAPPSFVLPQRPTTTNTVSWLDSESSVTGEASTPTGTPESSQNHLLSKSLYFQSSLDVAYSSRSVVFLGGFSGVGRSRLVHEFARQLTHTETVYFITGRCDETTPRSGLVPGGPRLESSRSTIAAGSSRKVLEGLGVKQAASLRNRSSRRAVVGNPGNSTRVNNTSRRNRSRRAFASSTTSSATNTTVRLNDHAEDRPTVLVTLVSALDELGQQICPTTTSKQALWEQVSVREEVDRLRTRVRERLPDLESRQYLMNLVPSLTPILQMDDDADRPPLHPTRSTTIMEEGKNASASSTSFSTDGLESVNKLKFLITHLFRAVASPECPIVLFQDDLQWQDQTSLDVLRTLLQDSQLTNFLFIGTYRSNLVQNDDPLQQQLLRPIEMMKRDRQDGLLFHVLHWQLEGLSLPATRQLVTDALYKDELNDSTTRNRVAPLADAIHTKTRGNVFFTLSLLQSLESKGLLTFNINTQHWQFDLDHLRRNMPVCENILSLVAERLSELPLDSRTCLTLAAFLPSPFSAETLELLMELCAESKTVKILGKSSGGATFQKQSLEECARRGLLVIDSDEDEEFDDLYQFSHDRIRQSSLLLVDDEERAKLGTTAARFLVELGMQGDHEMFYAAADVVNAIPLEFREHNTMEVYEVNSLAGEAAFGASAFFAALKYFERAISHLEKCSETTWGSHKDQYSHIFGRAAYAALSAGYFAKAETLATTLLNNTPPQNAKALALSVLAESLGFQNRHYEAMQMSIENLQLLDESVRGLQNSLEMQMNFMRVKRKLSSMKEKDFLNLPLTNDSVVKEKMQAYCRIQERALYCEKRVAFIYSVTRAVDLALKYGRSDTTAISLSGFAIVLVNQYKNVVLGLHLAEISRSLMRSADTSRHDAHVMMWLGHFIEPWTKPWNTMLKSYNRAYEIGMTSGTVEIALVSLVLHCSVAFLQGLPLPALRQDLDVCHATVLQYKCETAQATVTNIDDALRCLTGSSDDVDLFIETCISLKKNDINPSNALVFADEYMYRAQIAYMFGDFGKARICVENVEELGIADKWLMRTLTTLVFGSLIATAQYRQTKKNKYRSEAHGYMKRLKKLVKEKAMTSLHKYLLVSADFAATFGKQGDGSKTKAMFEKAISSASRSGFMQDAALANELCGLFFESCNDQVWARWYLSRAAETYRDWGASTKVAQLLESKGEMIRLGNSQGMKSSQRDRKWLIDKVSDNSSDFCNSIDFSDL